MNNRSVSSYTNPTQKTFNFHRERRELCDPNLCIDFLLHNQIDEFKNYVDQFPYVVNMKEGQNGNVALHIVSSRGDLGLIKFLIHNGAEVNIQDIFGNSPLHYAADKGKRSAIEILIAAGGNVNLQDFRGNAPIHLACTNNDTDTVKLLLKYNADPEITDLNDMKPGDRTNAPMIKMLLDRRINAVRTQEADAAQQSVQWMSFGVGLGKYYNHLSLLLVIYLYRSWAWGCISETSTDDDRAAAESNGAESKETRKFCFREQQGKGER